MIQHTDRILLASLVALSLTACDGMFAGLYDEYPDDVNTPQGFSTDPANPRRLTLTIDASDFGQWHYVSLKNKIVESCPIPLTCEGKWDGRSGITYNQVSGDSYQFLSIIPTDPQPHPEQWDFAIHRFDVMTNDGAVAATSLTNIDDSHTLDSTSLQFTSDILSTTHVMVDLSDMMAYRIGYQNSHINPVISSWVKMDISTPPPTYSVTGIVYILRLADGTMAAMRLREYYNAAGVKGHLTIDIEYPWRND